MHILITGAAGMIGRKLTARLVKDGKLNGAADRQADADRRGAAERAGGFRRRGIGLGQRPVGAGRRARKPSPGGRR